MRMPPRQRDPNTTQAFLMDSASDLVQVTNPVIIILQGDFFLCALMFKSSSEQTVILQCLPGPGFFCFFFLNATKVESTCLADVTGIL